MRVSALIRFLILAWAFFAAPQAEARDTLLLIDQRPRLIASYRVSGDTLYFQAKADGRWNYLDILKVYGVKKGNQLDTLYRLDTLDNNFYPAVEMAEYVRGQNDAFRHYRKRTFAVIGGGLILGALGNQVGPFVGPFSIGVYTTMIAVIPPAHKARLGYRPGSRFPEAYRDGYDTAAKRMAVRRAAWSSALGYFGGLITLNLLQP